MIDKRSRLKHLESLQFLSKRWLLLQIQTHPDQKTLSIHIPFHQQPKKGKKITETQKRAQKQNCCNLRFLELQQRAEQNIKRKGKRKRLTKKEKKTRDGWQRKKKLTKVEDGYQHKLYYILYTPTKTINNTKNNKFIVFNPFTDYNKFCNKMRRIYLPRASNDRDKTQINFSLLSLSLPSDKFQMVKPKTHSLSLSKSPTILDLLLELLCFGGERRRNKR